MVGGVAYDVFMTKRSRTMFYYVAISIILIGSVFLCAYSFFPLSDSSSFLYSLRSVDVSIFIFDAVMAILAALSSAVGALVAYRLFGKSSGAVFACLLMVVFCVSLLSLSRVYFL